MTERRDGGSGEEALTTKCEGNGAQCCLSRWCESSQAIDGLGMPTFLGGMARGLLGARAKVAELLAQLGTRVPPRWVPGLRSPCIRDASSPQMRCVPGAFMIVIHPELSSNISQHSMHFSHCCFLHLLYRIFHSTANSFACRV